MNLSSLINAPLGLLGLKLIRRSRLELVNFSDLEQDKKFWKLYEQVRAFSLVPAERSYALYQSVQYILKNNIPGDFVECGVWKGGSSMLMARCLQEAGVRDRKLWLYDTFEGMSRPGAEDGEEEHRQWEQGRVNDTTNTMCLASLDEVKANMGRTGYPPENIRYIKGKVEDTIPGQLPSSIALLRLDTDWYASTKHELQHLYPLVSPKGILIVDDYGAWQGARKATDEYFASIPHTFLHRIDYTGRLIVKTGE